MNALWLRNGEGSKWYGRDEETEAREKGRLFAAFSGSYCEQVLGFLIPNLLPRDGVLGIS